MQQAREADPKVGEQVTRLTLKTEDKIMNLFYRSACLFLVASFCISVVALQANTALSFQARSDPNDALRSARTIFIRTKSVYFKPAALEQSLLNRDEVQTWGLVFSRDEADADLIIEIDRKLFTNRFVYSVVDTRTDRVLMGSKVGSLGGTVEGQITESFINRLKRVRSLMPNAQIK